MKYYLIKSPQVVYVNCQNLPVRTGISDWLISIPQPADEYFQVLASKLPEDRIWYTRPFLQKELVKPADNSCEILLNSKESQEISKEEATLILFEAK